MDYSRRLLLLLLPIMLVPSLSYGRAKSSKIKKIELPTYNEMIKMDVKSRAATIQALREFMVSYQANHKDAFKVAKEFGVENFFEIFMTQVLAAAQTRECFFAGNPGVVTNGICKLKNYICGPAKVPCNPLLFGFDGPSSVMPICVNRETRATTLCENAANDLKNTALYIAENFEEIVRKVGKDKWEDEIKNIVKVCTDKKLQAETNKKVNPPPTIEFGGTSDCDKLYARIPARFKPDPSPSANPPSLPPPAAVPTKLDNVCKITGDFDGKGISTKSLSIEKSDSGIGGDVIDADLYATHFDEATKEIKVDGEDKDFKYERYDSRTNDISFRSKVGKHFTVHYKSVTPQDPKTAFCTVKFEAGDQAPTAPAPAAPGDACNGPEKPEVFCSGHDLHAACKVSERGNYEYTFVPSGSKINVIRKDIDSKEAGVPTPINKRGDFREHAARDINWPSENDFENNFLKTMIVPKDNQKLSHKFKDVFGDTSRFIKEKDLKTVLRREILSPELRNAMDSTVMDNYLNNCPPGSKFLKVPNDVNDNKGKPIGKKAAGIDTTNYAETYVCAQDNDSKHRGIIKNWSTYFRLLKGEKGEVEYVEVGSLNQDGDALQRTLFKSNSDLPFVEQKANLKKEGADNSNIQVVGKYLTYNTILHKCPYHETFSESAVNEIRITHNPDKLTMCQGDKIGGPLKNSTQAISFKFPEKMDYETTHISGRSGGKDISVIKKWYPKEGRWGCDFSGPTGALTSLCPTQSLKTAEGSEVITPPKEEDSVH